MFRTLAQTLLKRRVALVLLLAACAILSGALLPKTTFNFSPQALFASEDAVLSEDLKKEFGYEDTLLLILLQSPKDRDALERESLEWQARVLRDLPAIDGVERARGITNTGIPRASADGSGAVDTTPLVGALPVTEEMVKTTRTALKDAPLLEGQLFNRDRSMVTLAVYLDRNRREINDVTQIVDRIQALLQQNPAPEGYTVTLSGIPKLRSEIVSDLRSDLGVMFPATGVIYLIVLLLLFRGLSGTVLPLAAVGISVAMTGALLVLTKQDINLINNSLPVLLFVIGISDSIHLVSRYAEESQVPNTTPSQALERTLEHLGFACLLTSVTTAIGFMSLLVANNPLLRGFGWQAAAGVGIAYIVTILFLPAIMSWLKPPTFRTPKTQTQHDDHFDRLMDALARITTTYPKTIVALGAVLTIAALALASSVKVDSYLLEAYEDDHPSSETVRLVERELGGFLPFEVNLQAIDAKPDDRPFLTPEVYTKVAEFTAWSQTQDGVLWARAYTDFHQDMRAILLQDPAQRDTMPPLTPQGRAQIYQIQEVIDSSKKDLNYEDFITSNYQRARVLMRTSDIGSHKTKSLSKAFQDRLDALFPPSSGVKATLTGDMYVAGMSIDTFIRELFGSLLAASVIIFFVMAALFKSIRTGIIASIPNTIPLLLTCGYMGLRGYDLNLTNVVIFAISLGLAVDDTIHFLTRMREEQAETDNNTEAIRKTFRGAGRAIILTTILLLCGMAVLTLSSFVPTKRFAELTGVTLFGAIIGDLFILPALLTLFGKHPNLAQQKPE